MPCLSTPAKSTPQSSPVKLWPVKPLPSEKYFDISPPEKHQITERSLTLGILFQTSQIFVLRTVIVTEALT